jgi:hypothetical protein
VQNGSQAEDVNLSPSDLSQASTVIWKGADTKVHKGSCPALSTASDRNCPGIAENGLLEFDAFKDKLFQTILLSRATPPTKIPSSSADNTVMIRSLEGKIKRLNDRIAAGTLTPAETADFQSQVNTLNGDLANLKVVMTIAEQADFDLIVKNLDTGNDISLDEGERLFKLAVSPFGGGFGHSVLPPPAGDKDHKMTPTEIAAVLDYWNAEADMFYGRNNGYTGGSPVSITAEPITNCLTACPAYYSTLMCHFYCWHPSYQLVTPNVRGCFTEIARGTFPVTKGGVQLANYPEMFDYCMYEPFDAAAIKAGGRIPPYDQNLIDTNRKAQNKVGTLKYLTPVQADAFKFVTYTWYNPFAYDLQSQQTVLDQFYAKHPGVVSAVTATSSGKAMHPNIGTILPFMKAWDAAPQ